MNFTASIAAGLLALAAALPAAAQTTVYTTLLSGANESPPNASTGSGSASITIDLGTSSMHVVASFADLVAGNTAAHIHCCIAAPGVAGVATVTPTFTGFPSGTTSGTYDHIFDMTLASSWNGAFITSHGGTTATAFADLVAGLNSGSAYFNIHSTTYPSGEIRGFLTAAVPEPSSYALVLAGLGLVGYAARRRPGRVSGRC